MRRPTREELRRWAVTFGPFAAAWLLLSIWYVQPLWSARVLPIDDLPNHLARITALHYLDDPRWHLSDFYRRSLGLVPYLGHFYVVHLLAYVTRSVIRANLVYMSLYIAAAPLCGLALARATGRSPWLSLLLLPLSVGIFFQWGFISFCVGVMLLLPACALLYRTLDEPRLGRAVGLFALTCALYLCHILPWAAFGAYAIVLGALELAARRWKGPLAAAGALAPSLLLLKAGLSRAAATGYLHAHQAYHAEKDHPSQFLRRVADLFDLWKNRTVDEWVQLGLVALVLILIFSDGGREPEPLRRRVRLPLAVGLFFLFGLLTPFAVKRPFNWWMINVRFMMLVAAVAVFLPRGPIAGARAALLALGLAASTLLPFYMTRNYRDFSRKAEPILTLASEVPLGSSTLLLHAARGNLRPDFTDPDVAPGMAIWRELYNYPMVLRGGFDPYLYDDGFPVKRIAELAAPKVASAAVKVYSVAETRFDASRMLHGWDYFIVRADGLDAMPPDGVVRVDARGGWTLLKNLLKDQPAAPAPTSPFGATPSWPRDP